MSRKPTPLQVLLLVALVLFTAFITWRAKKTEISLASHDTISVLQGKPAPSFSLASLDGKRVSLADYRGKKKVVISYWASWCGPCRVELPQLKHFYEKYHKDDSDFEVVAISIDEDRDDAEHFAQKTKLPFPVLLDMQQQAAEAYSVEAIPATFIVDKEGKVKQTKTGLDEAMEIDLIVQLGLKMDNVVEPPTGKPDDDDSH